MKVKTGDVVFLYQTLSKIAEDPLIAEAPIDVKFLLVRNARVAQPIEREFMEARQKLAFDNSLPKEDSDERVASREQVEFINSEITKLENVEIDLPLVPISLRQLENLKLDLGQLSALYPIIINEEAY